MSSSETNGSVRVAWREYLKRAVKASCDEVEGLEREEDAVKDENDIDAVFEIGVKDHPPAATTGEASKNNKSHLLRYSKEPT